MEDIMKDKNGLAVITGASSGIGYELAKVFAENGYDLLVVAEDIAIIEAALSFRVFGTHVEYAQVDLSDTSKVKTLYDQIKMKGIPVEVIAVNAGVGIGGFFINNSWEEELNLMKLNVISSVYLTKLILQDMVAQQRGKILITSSIEATTPGAFSAVYSAAEAFLLSFTQAIRYEVKESRVTITSLMPGATDTNFFHRAHMDDTCLGAKDNKDDPAEVARDGFKALMEGKDHVIAGSFANTFQATKFIPEKLKAVIHRKMVGPGSA